MHAASALETHQKNCVCSRNTAIDDPVDLGTELHEAYVLFTEAVVPMILDEAVFTADFLLLYESTQLKRPKPGALKATDGFSSVDCSAVDCPRERLTTVGRMMLETLLGVSYLNDSQALQ